MTRVISIANEKGGVAKTTTTLSLSGALVEVGYRVLAIDLDPQANLSLSLGQENARNNSSLVDILLNAVPFEQAIKPTDQEKLSLLPANNQLGLAERLFPSKANYNLLLKNLLDAHKDEYDFILIDCPPFLGALTTNALMVSDLLVIPTQAEYYSVFALRNMMTLIRQIRANGNSKLRYRLLLTMFDKRNRIHCTLAEHLRTTFAKGVFETVIEVDTRLRESPIAGKSIIYHAPKSRSALQYRFLAQEIIQYVQN
ncbi:MAG: ParA family protein [Anaerolineaceae bacterium]|nr:ParA family protein [Anaerolineaceae bacterium]